jgi:AAA domain
MPARDRVEAALTAAGCRSYGRDSWTCPAHEDRSPSLMVQSGRDGRVIVKCHAGCDYRDILTALGLTMDDLFELPLREVARYPYRTDGMVYEKIRFAADGRKTFRWEPALNGHRMPLYRVDETLDLPGPVYLIESEKDVDTLLGMGVAATCMPGGAGDWREEYSRVLSGREVVIVADRDGPGVEHAMKARTSLDGKAASVRILQSATADEHDDVGDHLAAGFALSELIPLPRPGVREYKTVSLAAVMKKGVEPPVLLCDVLYEGGLHSVAGAPDCGKTTLALHWAAQLLRQGKYVLFLDEEGGAEIVTEKLIALSVTPEELEYLVYVPFPARSWTDEDITELIRFTEEIHPAMLLVDSSAAFLARAGLDENSAPAVTSWWSRVLTPIARDLGAAVVVIDHDTKSSEASRYARGSGAKLAALDVQLKVTLTEPFTRDQEGILKIAVTKDRRGWLHRAWHVEVHTGEGTIRPEFRHDDPEPSHQNAPSDWPPARRSLYEALTGTPRSIRDLVDIIVDKGGIPLKRETCSRELNWLKTGGHAERHDQGHGRDALWSLT